MPLPTSRRPAGGHSAQSASNPLAQFFPPGTVFVPPLLMGSYGTIAEYPGVGLRSRRRRLDCRFRCRLRNRTAEAQAAISMPRDAACAPCRIRWGWPWRPTCAMHCRPWSGSFAIGRGGAGEPLGRRAIRQRAAAISGRHVDGVSGIAAADRPDRRAQPRSARARRCRRGRRESRSRHSRDAGSARDPAGGTLSRIAPHLHSSRTLRFRASIRAATPENSSSSASYSRRCV
jgi:hypothetical protein